jgi:predicted nucleic acid-binding protein
MILLDTGPIVALLDASDQYHAVCVEILKKISKPLITTWPVITEAFYLLGFSWRAQDNLWEFIIRGGLDIPPWDSHMQARCRQLMEKHRDLPMDLADGTLVVLAEYVSSTEIFTLDHKDFKVYRTRRGDAFKLLPARL